MGEKPQCTAFFLGAQEAGHATSTLKYESYDQAVDERPFRRGERRANCPIRGQDHTSSVDNSGRENAFDESMNVAMNL